MNTAEDFIIFQGHVYQHNEKKFDYRTLQTSEIKKISTFSEHTSYVWVVFRSVFTSNEVRLAPAAAGELEADCIDQVFRIFPVSSGRFLSKDNAKMWMRYGNGGRGR